MTLFTYNRDTPSVNNDPSVDQPDMTINTNSIDDLLAVDHRSFNLNEGGKHNQVTLVNSGNIALQGVLTTTTHQGNQWPAWTNGLGTTLMLGSVTSPVANGYCSLPGGLLLQWGTSAATSTVPTAINFPIAFPTAVFNIMVCQVGAVNASAQRVISIAASTVNNFTPRVTTLGSSPSDSSATIYFIAIGN